ncbi:uncharacterized protein [Drosophila takahashii]|uniref:uncharacterized protein n=1 Tax=Drosophila takahashii TaxID=29030 RepID=UPI00389920FC
MSCPEKIENPNESLVTPKWLNKCKFESLLAKDEPDYTKIVTFTSVAAVPPGGNFTSVMFRVYLDLEMKDGNQKRKSYVVKTTLNSDRGGKAVDEMRYFQKEQLMMITLSAEKDLRVREFDNFVRIYWEYLIDCLRVLKYEKPLPQLRDLQSAIYKKNNTFKSNQINSNDLK